MSMAVGMKSVGSLVVGAILSTGDYLGFRIDGAYDRKRTLAQWNLPEDFPARLLCTALASRSVSNPAEITGSVEGFDQDLLPGMLVYGPARFSYYVGLSFTLIVLAATSKCSEGHPWHRLAVNLSRTLVPLIAYIFELKNIEVNPQLNLNLYVFAGMLTLLYPLVMSNILILGADSARAFFRLYQD